MRILVKNSSGTEFPLDVEGTDSVLSLKLKLESQHDLPAADLRLVCSGKILLDPKTLDECGLVENSVVFYVLARSPAKAAVTPSTEAGPKSSGAVAAATADSEPEPVPQCTAHPVELKVRGFKSCEVRADLCWTVTQFAHNVATEFGLQPLDFKLLMSGKILGKFPEHTLQSLGVHQDSKIMAVKVSRSQAEQEAERSCAALKQVEEAAQQLAGRDDGGQGHTPDLHFVVTNQAGQEVKFPPRVGQLIRTALAFHEKGRAKIRSKELGIAFELLLKGVEVLDQLEDQYTSMIDLVWVCLLQKDPTKLPRAKEWLNRAQKILHTTYGPNLERVKQVRGGRCPEKAVYVRLGLLQGVADCLTHNLLSARDHLTEALALASSLQINDASLSTVMAMGFSRQEARRALLYCDGRVEAAVAMALQTREDKQRRHDEERERHRLDVRRRRLGKTVSGALVDLTALERLVGMDFDETIAAMALRHADNDLDGAITSLTDPAKVAMLFLAEDERRDVTPMDTADGEGEPGEVGEVDGTGEDEDDEVAEDPMGEDAAAAAGGLSFEDECAFVEDMELEDGESHLDVDVDEEMSLITQYLAKVSELERAQAPAA